MVEPTAQMRARRNVSSPGVRPRSGVAWVSGAALALLIALCGGSAFAAQSMAGAHGRSLMGRLGVVQNEPAQIGASVMLLGKFDWELGECHSRA